MNQIKLLSFAETIAELDGGQTVEEIKQHIREVTDAVLETGNGGKVTITLSFKRNGAEGRRMVMVSDDVKATKPKVPKTASNFYVTEDGDLTRQNPAQPAFDSIAD